MRIAIYDADEEKRRPVFSYMHAEGLAEIEATDSSSHASRKGWAVAAAKEEWQSRARNLVENKLYKLGARCYAQADDRIGMLGAMGYQYFEESTKLSSGDAQRERLLRAARAFEMAGELRLAASCLAGGAEHWMAACVREKLGLIESAAKVLARGSEEARKQGHHSQAVALLTEAASVYERGGRLKDALSVRVTHKELAPLALQSIDSLGQQHPERVELLRFALIHLERAKSWDVCLQIADRIRSAGATVDDSKIDKIAQTAAFSHRKNGERRLMLAAVRQFSEPEAQIRFLRDTNELEEATSLLLKLGRSSEAVDLMLIRVAKTTSAERDDLLKNALAVAQGANDSEGEWIVRRATGRSKPSFPQQKEGDMKGRCDLDVSRLAETGPGKDFFDAADDKDAALKKLFTLSPGELTGPLDKDLATLLKLTPATRAVQLCQHLTRLCTANRELVVQQCQRLLRTRDAPPHSEMPTWQWLCAAAGHPAESPPRVRSNEFDEVLKTALLNIQLSWLRWAAGRYEERRQQLAAASLSSFQSPLQELGKIACDAGLSEEYADMQRDEVFLMRLGLRYMPAKERLDWRDAGVSSLLKLLYLDIEMHPGKLTATDAATLPFSCCPRTQQKLKAQLRRSGLWRLVLDFIHAWHNLLPNYDLLTEMRFGAAVHRIFVDFQSECNVFKMLDEKLTKLEAYRSQARPQYAYPQHRRKLPGLLLLEGAWMERRGRPGDLSMALWRYIDYLELAAQCHANQYEDRGGALCKPAVDMCMHLIERTCAVVLVIFAKEAKHELWLPESLAGSALENVNFMETRSRMPLNQLRYLRKRLADALHASLKLGLFDPLGRKSVSVLRDHSALPVLERACVLLSAIRASRVAAQLEPHQQQRLLVGPLAVLIQQCKVIGSTPDGPHRFGSAGARLAAFAASIPGMEATAYGHVKPSALQALLHARRDCMVRVELQAGRPGVVHVVLGKRLSAAELAASPTPAATGDGGLLLFAPRPRTTAPVVANMWNALAEEPQEDAADDEDDERDHGLDDGAIESEMLMQRKQDAASSLLQSYARARKARRELRKRRDLRKLSQPFYEADLARLRAECGPADALDEMAQRLSRFDIGKMQQEGTCLWCGMAWTSGHVGPKHWLAREQFMQRHFPMCTAFAPVLLQIDTVLSELTMASGQDLAEEALQSFFQARRSLEGARATLIAELDSAESARTWSCVPPLADAPDLITRCVALATEALQSGRAAVGSCEVAAAEPATDKPELGEEVVADADDEDEAEHQLKGAVRSKGGRRIGKRGGGSKGGKNANRGGGGGGRK